METSEKRVMIHRLLFKLGALDNKRDMLRGYGVESTTDLTDAQIDSLIARLKDSLNKRAEAPADMRRWRSNVLTQLNKCGVYATNNDWTAVNRFMLSPRICGKLLYELNVDELKKLYKKLLMVAEKKAQNDRNTVLNHVSLN